jgi:hypothetical protein
VHRPADYSLWLTLEGRLRSMVKTGCDRCIRLPSARRHCRRHWCIGHGHHRTQRNRKGNRKSQTKSPPCRGIKTSAVLKSFSHLIHHNAGRVQTVECAYASGLLAAQESTKRYMTNAPKSTPCQPNIVAKRVCQISLRPGTRWPGRHSNLLQGKSAHKKNQSFSVKHRLTGRKVTAP